MKDIIVNRNGLECPKCHSKEIIGITKDESWWKTGVKVEGGVVVVVFKESLLQSADLPVCRCYSCKAISSLAQSVDFE